MDMATSALTDLRRRVDQYPPDRHPVQHAAAQFNLGTALAQMQSWDEAEASLRVAADLFGEGLPLERARVRTTLGAVLRALGRPHHAREEFRNAAATFADRGMVMEQGAAVFNLGLCLRDEGEPAAAASAFRQARVLLPAAAPQQAAAARELGATLLMTGRYEEATVVLEEAVALARRTRDLAGLAVAANTMGLALLAEDRAADAIHAFTAAAAASPPTVRPEAYAMAKANLALAAERMGDVARARLAAEQALSTPAVADAAREVAQTTLQRIGRAPGSLATVVAGAEARDRPAVMRDEMVRWTAAPGRVLAEEADEFVQAVTVVDHSRPEAVETVALWLGALLEQPTPGMERVVRAAVVASARLPEDRQGLFHALVDEAMRRFHQPQWLRLEDTFRRMAIGADQRRP